MTTLPSNQDFATEVKFDRLNLLWRVTLIAVVVVGWLLLNVAMIQRADATPLLIPFVIVIAGMLMARTQLRAGRYEPAAWSYVLAGIAALGIGIALAADPTRSVLIFGFTLLIFIVGLLLPTGNTLTAALLASAVIIIAPLYNNTEPLTVSAAQVTAIIFTFIASFVAAQVTRDLYQIAEWALLNYQRERRVAGELFESQEALQRSLSRSEALSANLQETNAALDTARAAAEEAKHFRGQFLANMSHELRTPLNAIIGFSDTMLNYPMMYDNVELPSAYHADLNQINTSGNQLLTLINDILDLAKVDAGKLDIRMGRVQVQQVTQAAFAIAAGLIGNKPITLETDIPDHLPTVLGDEGRIRQVLLNLYSNAAKFTTQGYIRLSVRDTAEGVRFSVTDTGSGISPEHHAVIFEEFRQAEDDRRDPRSGAGLGLAISRQLLTLMGGRIWVESTPGEGSTFHFVLMRYPEDSGDDALITQPQESESVSA